MFISIHCLLCLSWCGAVSAVSSVDMNILPPVPTRVQKCTVNTLALTTLVAGVICYSSQHSAHCNVCDETVSQRPAHCSIYFASATLLRHTPVTTAAIAA